MCITPVSDGLFCSIQAFESFILRAPKEISPYMSQIIELCLNFLSYDPNYNYDEDEDDLNGDGMEVDEEEDDENEDDYR